MLKEENELGKAGEQGGGERIGETEGAVYVKAGPRNCFQRLKGASDAGTWHACVRACMRCGGAVGGH